MKQSDLYKLFQEKAMKGWNLKESDFPQSITGKFFPDKENIFKVFESFSPQDINFLVLGQDPYPKSYATGIAFTVEDCEPPKSLKRIMDEIYGKDRGTSDLEDWITKYKVFLLNAALTVPQITDGKKVRDVAGEHLLIWEPFIEKVVCQLNNEVHLIAWGRKPKRLMDEIINRNHLKFKNFSWAYHPMAAKNGNESFKSFWQEPNIGASIKMQA